MGIEAVREARDSGLLGYTIERALEAINAGDGKEDLAELYDICSDVMFKKRQYTDAVCYGEKCIETDPSNASGYSNLGWAMYWLGRNEEAAIHLEKAVVLAPHDAEAHYRLGSVYTNALGKLHEAEKEFTVALDLRPDYIFAWQQRGICFYQQEKYAQAESDYRRAAELGDSYSAYCLSNNGSSISTPGEKMALGRDFWAQNDTQTAVDYFKKSLEQGFDSPEKTSEVMMELADKLSVMKLSDEAESYYTRVIEDMPQSAEARSRRGWHYYCVSKDDQAEVDFRSAIGLDPENPFFYSRLGNLYAVSGRPELGLETLDPAVERHPLIADLFQARALCHKALGNADQARNDFLQADLLGSPDAQNNRRSAYGDEYAIDFFAAGVEMGEQNNLSGAIEQFRKAVELFREESRFQGDLAWRYTAKSLHNMGLDIHMAGGDPDEAAEAVREALDMDPAYVDAWITLGNIRNSGGKNAEALEYYSKAIELQPNDGRGFYSRGRINMNEQRFDEGVADFTVAINLYQRRDWKADAFYNRARCHEGAGRIHEAIEDFNQAFNNGIQQAIQESFRLKDQYGIE